MVLRLFTDAQFFEMYSTCITEQTQLTQFTGASFRSKFYLELKNVL